MAGLQTLKRRINSVHNTLKTTSAMQLISSVKMKRATETATQSRAFTDSARMVLARLLAQGGPKEHVLLIPRPVKTVLLVVVTSDKGLAGGYNSEVLQTAVEFIKERQSESQKVKVVTVGKKAADFFARIDELEVVAAFGQLGDSVKFLEASPLGSLLLDEYANQNCDEITVVYKHFVSTLRQDVTVRALVPVTSIELKEEALPLPYTYEPDAKGVLESVLPYLIKMDLYQMLLEANASEHAARMVAMKNATDAGSELVEDLTFTANALRQEKITGEIAEIAAGAAALQ